MPARARSTVGAAARAAGNLTFTPRWFEAGYVVLFLSMHDSSVFTVDEHVRSVLGAIGRIR
jgi:hypothetical protein